MRSTIILSLAATLGASEHIAIDQPADWYRPGVSHHSKHAVGGAVIGAGSYALVRGFGASRGGAVSVSVIDGFLVGCAYELVEGRHGRAYVDPVDALWTTAGSAVGGLASYATDKLVTGLAVIPRRDGIVLSWIHRF